MKKLSKQKTCMSRLLTMLFVVFAPVSLSAQGRTVTGSVTDSSGEPVMGATVIVKNTNTGAITGLTGDYSINAAADATLIFQSVGYITQEVPVNGRAAIDVALQTDATMLEDVVVVGYGTQKRGAITGSVASVKGDAMVVTKNENPQNMLTGKVAGLRTWQQSAEPGSYKAKYDIRGFDQEPIVVIDGILRDISDFKRMNANDIEDVSVLKDASAGIYGARSGNGVLLVITKKGKEGTTKVTYNGAYTFQKPSRMPELTDAYGAMTLWNEKKTNIDGSTKPYDSDTFEKFRNGTRRTTDWNSLIFADWSPQTQHDLSITGGSEKIQYYVSFGYLYQDSFFQSGDQNYNKFNVRSNVGGTIAKGLTFNLNLAGIADRQNNPLSTSDYLIRNYWRQGVLYPAYADTANTMLNYEGLDMYENTVAMMTADVSGFRKFEKKNFQGTAEMKYDFGTIVPALKGLNLKGVVGYDYKTNNNTQYRKAYNLYSYDEDNDIYNELLYSESSPNQVQREFFDMQSITAQILLNYDRTFADKHKVGAVLGWEVEKETGDNFFARSDLEFAYPYLFAASGGYLARMNSGDSDFYEYNWESLLGRLNYSYADRYIIEAQFRYDASSRLAPGYQWNFFPTVSGGWRISEEPFFKNSSAVSFINQLKLRASYGSLGVAKGDYEWLTGYTYPATGENSAKGYYNHWAPGYIWNGKWTLGMSPNPLPNYGITWERATMFNVGIDFEAWNGLFGFTFEYFDRHRTGIAERMNKAVPTVVGAVAPRENLNSDRNFGLELELTHRNKVGDFRYNMKAIATITRRMWLTAVNNGPYANSYKKWRDDNLTDRYQGVQFGYESAGRYTGWEDIWSYPIRKERNVLPGDYKYMDWNGDGEISGLDEHPYAFDQTPWLNYSLSFDAQYRNFDLNILFQGSALGSMQYVEPLYMIWGTDPGGGTLVQYMDRWHPADPSADIYDPETEWIEGYYAYTGRYPIGNSEFNRVSSAYLRLKSLEVGYTIPKIKALSTMDLRFFFNAYNLMTITGVKFVDPEHPEESNGRLYPLNRTFTVGLSLSF